MQCKTIHNCISIAFQHKSILSEYWCFKLYLHKMFRNSFELQNKPKRKVNKQTKQKHIFKKSAKEHAGNFKHLLLPHINTMVLEREGEREREINVTIFMYLECI